MSSMKKLCSFLLATVILFSFAVLPTYAKDEPRFELTNINGKIGDTVQIELNVFNNPGITALSVDIGYSAKDLELVSVEDAKLFEDGISTGVKGANPMKISWFTTDSENKTDSGTLAVLKFKIKENAENSIVTLSYNPENVFDSALENKKFEIVDGKVYIGEIPTEQNSSETSQSTSETTPSSSEIKPSEPSSSESQPTEPTLNENDISKWIVKGIKNKIYTGNLIRQNFEVISPKGEYAEFTAKYYNNKEVGTAKIVIKGAGEYTGTITKTFRITKATNPVAVKIATKSVNLSKLKKKAQTVNGAITVKKAQGKVSYKLTSTPKLIKKLVKINSKGVITISKWVKAKKGTYNIKVKITISGNKNYNSKVLTKTVTIKIK
ncbi:MAG: hypothetical protein SO152_06505 [Ruminococcus sp.]|nr:cohesin domain-containing protein [Ruminococcus sp.]MDD6708540.1 hypothetical protein [Ruminococcus sp.]MDY4813481.1 hypothetical protein [Ruminococcus sp.]